MADIFISYKRGGDEEIVEALVGGLRANGYSVWWDRDIPAGAPWEETILAELRGSRLAIVCWSKAAVDSENVRSEARFAKEQDRLLQLLVAPCQPPLFFGENQGLRLEEIADVYGPRFKAVLDSVRTRLGADPEQPEARRDDRAVRAWRRNEPQAPWEALQFGLSFSFIAVVAWLAMVVSASELQFVRIVALASGVGFVGVASAAAAWLAYSLLARRPRRIGFFRGTLLALVIGLVWGAGVLFYDALARAIVSTNEYVLAADPSTVRDLEARRRVPGWEVDAGIAAIAAFLGGVLLSRVWLPVFTVVLRRPLSVMPLRLVVVALAALAPGFAFWAALHPPTDSVELRRRDFWLAWGMAQAGFETLEEARLRAEDPMGRPAAEAVRRLETKMDFKIDDGIEAKGVWADLPARTEWTLAADGSGDGRTMQEILARSAGDIVIRVKPGAYGPEPDWSYPGADVADGPLGIDRDGWRKASKGEVDEVGPLGAAARRMVWSRTHRIAIVGAPGVRFRGDRGLTVPSGMRIENAELEVRGALVVETGAELRTVRLVIREPVRSAIEIVAGPSPPRSLLRNPYEVDDLQRPSAPLVPARIADVDVTLEDDRDRLAGVFAVRAGAMARITGGSVRGSRPTEACVRIEAARDVAIRDISLLTCSRGRVLTTVTPNANLYRNIAGMSEEPTFTAGDDQDWLRY